MLLKFSLTGFFMNWITQGGQTVSKLFSVAWIFFYSSVFVSFQINRGIIIFGSINFSVSLKWLYLKKPLLALHEKKNSLKKYLDNKAKKGSRLNW